MRVRAGFVPAIALLAAACSSSAAPTWTYAPAPSAAVLGAQATADPSAAQSAAPAATPSPAPAATAGASPAPPSPTASEAPAASPAAPEVHQDAATLSEFKITLASAVVTAGKDTFAVTNSGTIAHEFVIKRTDVSDTALPTKPDGTVDEESSELSDVGEVEHVTPGTTKNLTESLAPGSYVFFCNIAGHYVGGMHGSFTVAPAAPEVHASAASLTEYKIALTATTLSAGKDTFTVTNSGTIAHEFVIRKTTLADDALPTKADGTIDEEAPALGDVGEVELATPGSSKDLAVDLAPGSYVFFCNIPGHYKGGMHGSFTVTGEAAPAPVSKSAANLTEYKIALTTDTLAAGKDTFTVTNGGTIAHEFVIRKTTLADDALPTKADGTIDEEAPALGDVGEVEIPTPGATKQLTVNLTPGSYVFFCNIPGHYKGGMHGSFTVTGEAAPAPVSKSAANLTEYKIALTTDTLAAGKDTFTVTNGGTIAHEFVIRKTTLADDALPTKADGTIDEEAPALGDVGEVEIPTPGATKQLTVNLTPGSYVFFCNIPGHYKGGMHGSFTVTDAPASLAPGGAVSAAAATGTGLRLAAVAGVRV